NHELGVLRKSPDVVRDLEVHLDAAAFLEALQVIAQGKAETGLVEIGRVQQVGDGAKLAARLFEIVLEFAQKRQVRRRQPVSQPAGYQAGGDQILAGAVMKIASNPPPLLVLRAHQGCGEHPRRLSRISQLLHHRPKQQNRYRQAREKELKGKDAHF